MKRTLLAACAAGLLTPSLSSAESLLEVYEHALLNDHQLKADRAAYESGLEARTIGRSAILPQINADVDWRQSESERTNNLSADLLNPDGESDSEDLAWGVTLAQPLFNMSAWHTYKQGAALSDQAEAQFAADQQDLITRTTTTYFNVLRAIDNLDTALAEEKALSHQLEQTRQRFEVGLTAITDVHEAQAAYDAATATTLENRGLVGIAFEELEALTGTAYTKVAPLEQKFPVKEPEPAKRSEWVDFALANNYTLKVANLSAESNRRNAKQKKAGHYPTLALTAGYRETNSNGNNFYDSEFDNDLEGANVGLTLDVPIFSGLRTSGERRQAYGQFKQAEELYFKAQRDTIQAARSFHLAVVTGVAQVKARKQAITSSDSALKATQAGYEVGTRNLVDVLTVQRTLFEAKRNYSNALYDYIINLFKLKEVAGNLTPDDVKAIDQWLAAKSQLLRANYDF